MICPITGRNPRKLSVPAIRSKLNTASTAHPPSTKPKERVAITNTNKPIPVTRLSTDLFIKLCIPPV